MTPARFAMLTFSFRLSALRLRNAMPILRAIRLRMGCHFRVCRVRHNRHLVMGDVTGYCVARMGSLRDPARHAVNHLGRCLRVCHLDLWAALWECCPGSCRCGCFLHPVHVVVLDGHRVAQLATVRDRLYLQLLLGQRHVHEAVLVVGAILGRRVLGGGAAAPARDHPCVVELLVVFGVVWPDQLSGVTLPVQVLRVPVRRDDKVDLMLLRQLLPIVRTPIWGEVRHYDAPISSRLGDELRQPRLL
eukprot:CAMPEP_0180675450 /NCGR_PEP_ID=MMETSP1037_2-20121125/66755_1 /TAXON_ID=632150 /ORGANISM="Azadinium spinosum, Strain 3D9" /LENGTH=245 /DNA_ID=CAMNT_0022704827 /DNA_START=112 /DNA_END=846 /DNA_ORIENTATION=-